MGFKPIAIKAITRQKNLKLYNYSTSDLSAVSLPLTGPGNVGKRYVGYEDIRQFENPHTWTGGKTVTFQIFWYQHEKNNHTLFIDSAIIRRFCTGACTLPY